MIQSKCFRFATGALRYVSNRQIHEDLGVPLFDVHIRALAARFDSKSADVENPSKATRQIITLPEGRPLRLTRRPRAPGASRPVEAIGRDVQVD